MPSMMPVISAIRLERSLMSLIVPTTRATASLLRRAMSDALAASALASRALSAFCLTADVSSSDLARAIAELREFAIAVADLLQRLEIVRRYALIDEHGA